MNARVICQVSGFGFRTGFKCKKLEALYKLHNLIEKTWENVDLENMMNLFVRYVRKF